MTKTRRKNTRKPRSSRSGSIPRSLHLEVHRFIRRSIGHFYIGGTSDPDQYHNEGDGFYFALRDGLISNNGKLIDSAPDVTSTLAYCEIPAVAEFTSLFDQYRIRRIKITMVPLRNVASGNSSYLPTIYVSRNDYNSVQGPATLAALLQREDTIIHRMDSPLEFTYKPKVLSAQIDLGNTISANSQFDNQWLNTSDLVVMHSGFKVWFDSGGATGTTVSCMVCMYIEFDLEFRAVQ